MTSSSLVGPQSSSLLPGYLKHSTLAVAYSRPASSEWRKRSQNGLSRPPFRPAWLRNRSLPDKSVAFRRNLSRAGSLEMFALRVSRGHSGWHTACWRPPSPQTSPNQGRPVTPPLSAPYDRLTTISTDYECIKMSRAHGATRTRPVSRQRPTRTPAAEVINIFVLATRAENAARVYGGTFCR